MKPKKTKKANLENKKGLFFELGLIASLALALLAFEWSSAELQKKAVGPTGCGGIGVEIINTYTKKDLPPEVKPPEVIELVIKDNTADVLSSIINSPEIDPWETVYSPPEIVEKPEDIPFRFCAEPPSFMNGTVEDFVKFIQSVVIYPEEALRMEIQGKVYADFVLNKEGYIEKVTIVRGVDPLLDNEVIRALKTSPRWTPGKQRGMPVKFAYTIPIVFKINN